MTEIEKTYESSGHFKKMEDNEVEELVKDCFDGKTTGIRSQDTIVSLRKDVMIVDVFTITRHRIFERVENVISTEGCKIGCPVCFQEVDTYKDEGVLRIEHHHYRNSELQCPGSCDEVKFSQECDENDREMETS